MAKLIYSMITSLDGYAEAAEGASAVRAAAMVSRWRMGGPSWIMKSARPLAKTAFLCHLDALDLPLFSNSCRESATS